MSENEQLERGPEHLEAGELLELYHITDDDLARIRSFGQFAAPRMDEIIEPFYAWLRELPEYEQFFSDPETLDRVIRLQREYWHGFMDADIDEAYVQRRQRVGEVHARIGLPLGTYFAAMNMFLEIFSRMMDESEMSDAERAAVAESAALLLHLDTAVVVEMYNGIVERQLGEQSRSLMEMSTPVTQIWHGILLLPIVGIIDSRRARDMMNAILAKISSSQAEVFIMDISGVAVVDTAVANHLIKITRATRLMGCNSIISGVSPAIAQTIVELGIDVGTVKTTATMQDALADAFRRVGTEITSGVGRP